MRTQEEILRKIERESKQDLFGFATGFLAAYLTSDNLAPLYQDGKAPDDWEPMPSDHDSVLKEMEAYMPFAWDKANNKRGLSAGRSMIHYTVWIWMLANEDEFGDLRTYSCYGKDHLRKICEFYGWDANQWDDGIRENY